MTRSLFAAIALATVLSFSLSASFADEQKPQAAQPAAPAESGKPAVNNTGGCMQGGGCCGDPACAAGAAAGSEQKPAAGDAAEAAGGCPCQKMKAKKSAM